MARTGVSIWTETAQTPQGRPLAQNERADVCVVGAGIAGLTTAYLLAKAGLAVVVLDAKDEVASGESAYTTAHLACVLDDRFREVERVRGEGVLRAAVASHAEAIRFIERTAQDEGIECGFRRVPGYLFLSPGDPEKLLDDEADAARRIGLPCQRLPSAPLPKPTRPCLRFADQARFHPLRYLAGLCERLTALGGRVFTGARVERVLGGSPCQVILGTGAAVTAGRVVVATNTPINDVVSLHTKQAAYTTYALSVHSGSAAVEDALYWDTEDPYHYVRLEGDALVVGGADHKTGQNPRAEESWGRLERWARERVLGLGEVRHKWSGQVFETLDGLAYLGRDPGGQENVYIATGDSGMGLTHGTIGGMLLADLIRGRRNAWEAIYDPSRTPARSAGTFVSEGANVAAQYLDWLTPGDVPSEADVPAGGGAVLRRGLKKVAAYRDEKGESSVRSAVCPHLGCVVHWNDGEKTWDCPCHGSRFGPKGEVTHGPAAEGLAEA